MEEKDFFKRLSKRDYENLEKELLASLRKKRDLNTKYFLGICYSKQYSKWNEAITIFKELLNENFKSPAIYLFLAKRCKSDLESAKYIKEGIKNFSDNIGLKKALLFYLDNDDKENYFLDLSKSFEMTFDLLIEMISFYYKKQEYEKALQLLDNINDEESPNNTEIQFLKIAIPYLANKAIDIENINSFLVADNNSFLGLIIRLIEIDVEKNKKLSKKMIQQLNYMSEPDNPFIEIVNFKNGYHSYFMVDSLFYLLINRIEQKFDDEELKRKLKLMYAFQEIYMLDEETELTKTRLKEIQKLIDEELKSHNDKILFLSLLDVYRRLKNNKKYFETYVKAIENSHNIEYADFSYFNSSELENAVNYVIKNVRIYDFNANKYQCLIEELIINLHKEKNYASITKILDSVDYEKMDYLKFGFEIAFALNETKRTDKAKEIYEQYINLYPNSEAAINNLGVIYEKEGNYKKALEYFLKSENLLHNEISSNNIERCKNLIEQLKKEQDMEQKALDFFRDENAWIISKIKLFYEETDETGNIICPYSKLPSILKCNSEKAQDVLKQFLDKGYIFRNKNHSYNTTANVYKKNFSIEKRIVEIEKENNLIASFTNNLDNFTIKNLTDIEYNKILSKLNTVKKKNIKEIFIRDYNEVVFSYLTNQQKTVVLMSGTLIELLLLFILDKNKIVKYKVGAKQKDKKVVDMDISEMLEVCDKEQLVHNTPKKFIDGMKQFRNFIHPGKELREKTLEIDKSTLELSFSIVNWLIINIDLK